MNVTIKSMEIHDDELSLQMVMFLVQGSIPSALNNGIKVILIYQSKDTSLHNYAQTQVKPQINLNLNLNTSLMPFASDILM